MKKTLLFSKLVLAFMLFFAMNVSAQDVYFLEGFATDALPDGWTSKDVSFSSASSNAPNIVLPDDIWCAKMKTNNDNSAWIQFPQVNGATDLSFSCKVKAPEITPTVIIQTSTDGATWTDFVTNPAGLDLANSADFQQVVIPLNIEGAVYIRIYVSTVDPGTAGTGTLTVDDIQLGKPAVAANDASLISISIDSTAMADFNLEIRNYNLEISHAMGYSVQAEANDPSATVVITQVSDINGTEAERTATIVVTSADQSVSTTTTIVFSITDYWYKEGFDGSDDLAGWGMHGTFQTSNIKVDILNQYEGEEAIKFTRGHETGNNAGDRGYLRSPKLPNLGTLTFWTSAETVLPEHQLDVYIFTSDTDSTLVKSIVGNDLTFAWQEVVVVIESEDSVQIKIVGTCDINDAGDSRIWMDDFLLTYWEAPVIGADDATLSSLAVGGTEIAGFDPSVTSYTMEASILIDPTVTAETSNANATVVITQAIDVFGTLTERTATVVVTSADGTVTSTTTIEFNPSTSISDFNSSKVSFYPNPVNSLLNFKMPENSYQAIEIFNMLGQKVMQETIKVGQKSINVDGLSKGVYVMSLSGEAGTHIAKFIKE